MSSTLQEQAADFAARLTSTVRYVSGPDCDAFGATTVPEASVFRVRQEPSTGIVLFDENGPLLRLTAEYFCTWDGHEEFLAVDNSKVAVYVAKDGREPLFRYEFERLAYPKIPSAHIQFHGTHPELERVMRDCGESTPRARWRKNAKAKSALSALHFPVGGPRFRPVLEDVLQMLIEELGIQPHGGSPRDAYNHLADAREQWRRLQVATCVRDAPSEAVEVLRKLGYHVSPPAAGVKPGKPDKLRAL